MTRYARHVNLRETPQRERARADQVRNSAGGYVFELDKWGRLDRFLILGAEGGTYYVSERKLVRDNAKALAECIAENGPRTVRRIIEVSDAGRAPKNDPAIFALAMCAGAKSPETRKAALAALPIVCRIGTHLFHFANDVRGFRGWGPALVKAIARWYTARPADRLAYDLVKYQSRDGWGHRDLIRLSHPKAEGAAQKAALAWSARGLEKLTVPTRRQGGGERGQLASKDALPAIIGAFEEMHSGIDVRRAVELIRAHKLPHECVPNELKGKPEVWDALSEHMAPNALLRNLNKLTSVGLLKPMSSATARVVSTLTNPKALFKARVHPMKVLLALKTYAQGHGFKGNMTWTPVREIVDALDEAFYLAFEAVEPTGKRMLLALDVSRSMSDPLGDTALSCREAAAAMAMVTARTEKHWHCLGFTAPIGGEGRGGRGYGGKWGGGDSTLTPLTISPRQRLNDVVKAAAALPMGGTDCSLPMRYALAEKLEVDAFVVYTDNETWAGPVHPIQALAAYREKMARPAKLVVVGMTSTGFTIAAPDDADMLDVVGFDAAAPAVIADFTADRGVTAASSSGVNDEHEEAI